MRFHPGVIASAQSDFIGYDIIGVFGQSNERGAITGDLDAALDADPTGRIRQFAISGVDAGTIVDINTGVLFHPISATATEVGPGFAFVSAYATTIASNRKVLLVPYAVGGQAFFGDGMGSNAGWNPDGAGPEYGTDGIGGSGVVAEGSLYLGFIAAMNKALEAAEAEFGIGSSQIVGLYGGPGENDIASATYPEYLDKFKRAVQGFRTGMTDAATAWCIVHGCVPEWIYNGADSRPKIDAARKILEEELPYYAYVDSPTGYQSVEVIHFTGAGNRAKGTLAASAIAIAAVRMAPVPRPVDYLDGVANVSYVAGLVRKLSAYGTGNAFRLHKGVTELDIPFLATGYPDWDMALNHAGAGSAYVTRLYDQVSGTTFMIPEGTQVAGMQIVTLGDLLFQGKRPTFGNDLNLIMLKDTTYTLPIAGAVLVYGRFQSGGNKCFFGSQLNAPALLRTGGSNLIQRINGSYRTAGVVPEVEPAFAIDGFNNHSHLAGGTEMYIDGLLSATTDAGSGTYISAAAIALGGIVGVTNRYGISKYSGLVCFAVNPAGADLASVNSYSALYVAKDSFATDDVELV